MPNVPSFRRIHQHNSPVTSLVRLTDENLLALPWRGDLPAGYDEAMNPPGRTCRGPLDRRTWLRIGGISLGALASGGLPGLTSLLAAEATHGSGDEFSVILFWAN